MSSSIEPIPMPGRIVCGTSSWRLFTDDDDDDDELAAVAVVVVLFELVKFSVARCF